MKRPLISAAAVIAAALALGDSSPAEPPAKKVDALKIRIKIGDKKVMATLAENATARDFASLLPLTLTLQDYAATEKISDLPKRLSTTGTPAGHDPSVGDITYYAPWGNLAIFHQDFRYSPGLIQLGKVEGDLEALTAPGAVKATIELAE